MKTGKSPILPVTEKTFNEKKFLLPEKHFLRNKTVLAGAVIIFIFVAASIFAPFLAPYQPEESFNIFTRPSSDHFLGTNDVGKDILSELIYAGRVSLTVGLLGGLLSSGIGTLIGILAGYYRNVFAEFLGGLIDVFLLIPRIPLLIVLGAYLGTSIWNIILIIGFLTWGSVARVIWARAAQIKEMHYIEGAQAIGCSDRRIIFIHIIPNLWEIFKSKFVLSVAGAMLAEASLSFLGLGDPRFLSWGIMLHYSFHRGGFAMGLWNWFIPPGICIALSVYALFLLGEKKTKKSLDIYAEQQNY
jgi:peptide/nickel transport system permease protein